MKTLNLSSSNKMCKGIFLRFCFVLLPLFCCCFFKLLYWYDNVCGAVHTEPNALLHSIAVQETNRVYVTVYPSENTNNKNQYCFVVYFSSEHSVPFSTTLECVIIVPDIR